MRWILYWKPWYYTCCGIQYKGNVYPYTLSDLSRHELKETGLREYALRQKKIDPGREKNIKVLLNAAESMMFVPPVSVTGLPRLDVV